MLFLGINSDFPESSQVAIARCGRCSVAFSNSAEAYQTFEDLYFEGYFGESTGERALNKLAISLFQSERRSLALGGTKVARVLDVGCGDGTFLRFLPEGIDRFGYEPSAAGRKKLSQLGIEHLDIDSYAPEYEHSFDLITLWQSFEHIQSPDLLFLKLRRLVAPSGRIFISVPNFGSLQAKLFRGRWFHLDPTRHVFHYEMKTLEEICGRNGFELTWSTTFSFEYGVFGFWQSLFNLTPFEFNMGYKLLKGRMQFRPSLKGIAGLVIYALLGLPFGLLSVILASIEAGLGRGAVLQGKASLVKESAI